MQFVYHEHAKQPSISIENELYKYLFKVRRHELGDVIDFRNLNDSMLYSYKIQEISKRHALLEYTTAIEKRVEPEKSLHLAWCVIDPKTIEKQLPYLNELGVSKISFVYADYSQKNFKLDFEKYKKILINSCQQCGRSSFIEFEVFKSVDEFLSHYPQTFMLHFSTQHLNKKIHEIKTILIGCEGGFSKRETKLFAEDKVVGFDSNLILRSQTAALSVCAKLLV